jgi:hypothetical protein
MGSPLRYRTRKVWTLRTRFHEHVWPVYEAALAAEKKAQFRRARLFVDGVHVPVPMPAR